MNTGRGGKGFSGGVEVTIKDADGREWVLVPVEATDEMVAAGRAQAACAVRAAINAAIAAAPTLGLAPHSIDVDWLSNVIRTVDGNHSLGAGALAEKIVEAINARGVK